MLKDEAFQWITADSVEAGRLEASNFCQTRDVFQARLDAMAQELVHDGKLSEDTAYLVTAIAGEIGNNSFDHNIGNWPDVPGIFFGYEGADGSHSIVLADRGQGVFTTIKNVKPDVSSDRQALKIAFTEIISGRGEEKRGNGLKFVRENIENKKWSLRFDSGRASLEIDTKGNLKIHEEKKGLTGCFAVIKY